MAKINTAKPRRRDLDPGLGRAPVQRRYPRSHRRFGPRRRATTLGQFDPNDLLQRELEYRRYASEAKRQPTWPQDEVERRHAFDAFGAPPAPAEGGLPPNRPRTAAKVQRAAWEARGLLDFLRHFRAPHPKAYSRSRQRALRSPLLSSSP